jgi:PKD repeat protein
MRFRMTGHAGAGRRTLSVLVVLAVATAVLRVTCAIVDPCGKPVAVARAFPTTGDAPLLVQFRGDASYVEGGIGQIDSLRWDFGNGRSGTQQNDTVTYTAAGVYLAGLTVTGCHQDAAAQVKITVR